jgi:hypothetical protein
MAEWEYWQKNKPKCRSPGCRLQFGGAKKRPSAIALQAAGRPSTYSTSHARSTGSSSSRCFVFSSKDAMRAILF